MIKLLKENLIDASKPYMLSTDGAFIKCDNFRHPYVISHLEDKCAEVVFNNINNPTALIWFYRNSTDDKLKDLIAQFTNIVRANYEKWNTPVIPIPVDVIAVNKDYLKESTIEQAYDLLKEVNELSNRLFCRVRCSAIKWYIGTNKDEIYFRIYPSNIDWLDKIWQVVHDHRIELKDVTVVEDSQSTGGDRDDRYIVYRGTKLRHVPVEQFLSL